MENPTRDNAQPDIVGHKRGGVVAANPKALITAMTMLKDDPELLEHCQTHGRQHVIDTFNKQRVSKMLIALLEHVHNSTSPQNLASKINQDPLLITQITDTQIEQAGGGRVGSYTLSQRIIQNAVLRPLFQTVYQRFKAFKSK